MSTNDSGIVDFSGTALSEEDIEECVKELRKLVLEDNQLKSFRTEDEYLLRFLHNTNFSTHSAFKKMQAFHDLLLEYPNWYGRTSPMDKKSQIEKYDKALLRERDKSGRNIIVIKLERLDAVNSYVEEQAEILEMWMEFIMDDPKTQATGLSVIIDMRGYSWRIFRWVTPSNIKIAAKRIDVYPVKELLIHVVNTSFLFTATIKLIWPFLNDKLKNMFKFHFDNWPSLHEYVSPEVLPFEYGGTGPDIDFEKSVQLLFDKNSEIEAKLKHHRVPQK